MRFFRLRQNFLGILGFFLIISGASSLFAGTHSAYGSPMWFNPVSAEKNAAVSTGLAGFSVIPNPAAAGKSVCFQLQGKAEAGEKMELKIYTVTGTLIMNLPIRELQANGRLTWTQQDKKGKVIPAGVYLVRLKAGNKSFENKLLILK